MTDEYPAVETRCLLADDPQAIILAVEAMRAGQVVVLPTDTVYGVGCDLWNAEALRRLYWAKRRPDRLAIPVLISAIEHVSQVAEVDLAMLHDLAAGFWPGALTVVLPRKSQVPLELGADKATVAVRMPDHPVALRLIAAAGGALAVTSANLSGRPAGRTAQEALADLQGRVAIVLDAGPCPSGVPSSIVDLTSRPSRLLRAGALSLEMLRHVLPDLQDME